MKKNQGNKNGKGAKVQNLAHKTQGKPVKSSECEFDSWSYLDDEADLCGYVSSYESSPENCYFN